jgi:metal-responsive CopG/Arc/MetJ family transcriptional regulator
MDEIQNVRITVSLPAAVVAKLDAHAAGQRWSRSTAAAVLIERGLDRDEHDHDQGEDHR